MSDPGVTRNGRRLRHDGWSPARRRAFLDLIEQGAGIVEAARLLGLTTSGLYQLRTRDPEFARQWNFAMEVARDTLEAAARERALNGVEADALHNGKLWKVRQYSDKLLMRLLDHRRSMQPPAETMQVGRSTDEMCADLERLLGEGG